MAKGNKQFPDAISSPMGEAQIEVTNGNIATPVNAFGSDSGLGRSTCKPMYGAPTDGDIPKAEKYPKGNAGAMNSYFGKGRRT